MSHSIDFQAQIASIMEVLANAAVAEICKVVDDGYAVVHLEMSQNHKENEFLKRKIKLMELQIAKLRAERRCQDGALLNRFHGVQLLNRQNRERTTSAAGLTVKNRFRNLDVRAPRPPTELPIEKSSHVLDNSKGSEDMEEGEPDLLIIKEEKPDEPKSLDQETDNRESGPCHENAYDVDAHFLPSAVPVEPRTRHSDVEDKGLDDRKTITKPVKQENAEEALDTSDGRDKPGICAEDVCRVVEVDLSDKAIQPEGSKDGMRQRSQLTGSKALSKSQQIHSDWPSCSAGPSLDCSSFRSRGSLAQAHGTMGELSPGCSDEKPDVIIIDPSPINETQNTHPQWHSDTRMLRANKQPQFCRQGYNDGNMQGPRDQSNGCHPHSQREGVNIFNSESYEMEMNTLGSYGERCVGLDDSSSGSQHLSWVLTDSGDNVASTALNSLRRGRSFSCTLCGKRYMTVKQLKVHQKVHAGEKPYSCIQCGKRFIQLYSLKRHQRVHTGERPFRCAQCGKQFAHSSNLKVHQTVHTGEKNFHCTQCGKNFSFLSNLIRHQAIHAAK